MAFWGSEVLFPTIKISEVFLIRDASSELWIDFISPFLRGRCCSRVVKHILNMMFLGCGYSATQLDDMFTAFVPHCVTDTSHNCQKTSQIKHGNQRWLMTSPKVKTSSEVLYLTFQNPQKNIPKTHLKFSFGWSLPEKHPHIHFKPEKKTETLGINLTNPGNQPYQPWESTLPTCESTLPTLGNPLFWVAFLLATCGQQSKRAAKGKDARPRTWWNQSAKQQNEGWTGRPVGNGTFQISFKKIKEHQRCCFTFYFYLVRDMLFQNMFHFAEIFQKSICLCSSGNLSDVFVGHRIRRFFLTLGVLPSGKLT